MRTIIVLAASALALCACNRLGGGKPATAAPAASSVSLACSERPARKAGLWEQTMTRDGVAPGLSLMGAVRMCIDAATQTKLSLFGDKMAKGACRRLSVSRSADGACAFVTTCGMGPAGVATSKATLSGDLSRAYRLHLENDITGSTLSSMNGHHVTDIAAAYLGSCPAGMIPGDVVLGNGMKINVNTFGAAAAALSGGG